MESSVIKNRERLCVVVPALPPGQGGMERQAKLQITHLSKFFRIEVFSKSILPNLFDSRVKFHRIKPYIGPLAKEINTFRIFIKFFIAHKQAPFNNIYIHQFNLLTYLILALVKIDSTRIYIKLANSGEKFDLLTFVKRYSFAKLIRSKLEHRNVTFLCLTDQNLIDFHLMDLINVNTIIINNGVEHSCAKHDQAQPTTILYLGRIEPIKKVIDVVNLAKQMPDYRFIIVGDGSERKKLMESSKNLINVEWLGEVSHDAIPWCEAAWIILPSEAEGMSNTLLEAVANQKGVICRPIHANAFLNKLTNKIIWLDRDLENLAKKIRDRQYEQVILGENFDDYRIENVAQTLRNIFTSLEK